MKKKYSLLYVFILLTTLPTIAQIKVGIEAGMNLSHFKHGSGDYAQKEGGMKPGFQVGATIDYEFKKNWTLMSGLSFMQTKSNMELAQSSVFFFPKAEVKLNHLMIPLKIGYNIRLSDNLSLTPSIGVYGSYDFSAGSSSLEYIYPSEDGKSAIRHASWKPMKGFSYEYPTELSHPYMASIGACRNWTYGGIGGLKAVIQKHYTISFSYYESIKKTLKYNGLRNYGFQLSVGYQF